MEHMIGMFALYTMFSVLGIFAWVTEEEHIKIDTWGKLILAIVLVPGWILYGLAMLIAFIFTVIWVLLDKPIFRARKE